MRNMAATLLLIASAALLWGGGTNETKALATPAEKTASTMGQKVYPTPSAYEQATGHRNRAIAYMMLNTGIR